MDGTPNRRNKTVFKFLRFEERFRKAPFSRRISVDGTPNRRNKPRLCLKISPVLFGCYLSVSSPYFCPIRKVHKSSRSQIYFTKLSLHERNNLHCTLFKRTP